MILIIGLIILFNLIKFFNNLAREYRKTRWKWILIGLVTYYGTLFISQMIIGFIYYTRNPDLLEPYNSISNRYTEIILGLISIPFGLLSCYLLHRYLEKRWKKENKIPVDSIDEIGKS